MISPKQLAISIATTILGLVAAYLLNIAFVYGFSIGLLTLIFMSFQAGLRKKVVMRSMWNGIKHTKEVMWILALVGLMIPAWTASGTIPLLIDTALSFTNPAYFLTFSFLISCVISMVLGTSTGTLSSVGIPLMGVGAILNIPPSFIAGALASGAFVGDRTSPFSSAHQLVAASTGSAVRAQYRAFMPTTIGAIAVSASFFVGLDISGDWHEANISYVAGRYEQVFQFSPWLYLPVCMLIGSILLRWKTRHGFIFSTVCALVLGWLLQGVTVDQTFEYLWSGYQSNTFAGLQTKGFIDMIELIVLIGLAGAFNGILEETRVLQPYMRKMMGSSTTLVAATWRVGVFGLGLGLVSCTQTLPIMMTGRNLLPYWESRFQRTQLARVVADTSLIFAAMIPWNMLAVVCGTILGVPVEQYVAFAPFLWLLPFMTLGWSYVVGRRRHYREINY